MNVGGLPTQMFNKASVATKIAYFNSRCRYNKAEAAHSRYHVTAATLTCPHHSRGEFMLAAPRLHARLLTAIRRKSDCSCCGETRLES